ncbi:hypothetical protein [Natrialba swarupiae]|uniref:Uncharacterized protein n=1 Tax=Natrialba swarupiae TaxID=2448032 RepID=A0A5D5AUM2_9EURY|nr:hypothetical protein [Natrialba swarupiae]TYT62771.1 hypothetical protein FYC77_06995 [Natrialba swarupiae]
MYGPVQIAGYAALVVTPVALVLSALAGLPEVQVGTVGVQAGIVLVGGVAAVLERRRAFGGSSVDASGLEETGFDETDAIDALAVVVGAVVTFLASVSLGLGPVVASALVGVLAGVFVPRVAVPAYCGSFVGMASPSAFPSLEYVAAAGVISGIAYVATTESFDGVGGKLGTIALCGCLATVVLTGLEYGTPTAPQWGIAAVVVAVAVVAAVATLLASVRLELGAVVASGLVGVVAGVAFPAAGIGVSALAPETASTLAAVAFCASFVGMSSVDRLSTAGVAGAGGLSGLVFLAVTPAVTGAGGKLGTIAFVSCLAVLGALELSRVADPRRNGST